MLARGLRVLRNIDFCNKYEYANILYVNLGSNMNTNIFIECGQIQILNKFRKFDKYYWLFEYSINKSFFKNIILLYKSTLVDIFKYLRLETIFIFIMFIQLRLDGYKNIIGTGSINYHLNWDSIVACFFLCLPVLRVGCGWCSLQSGPHPHCSRHEG